MPDRVRNPHNLPTKICPVCNRAFTWRKKWERDWDSVRYCSDQCRRSSASEQPTEASKSLPASVFSRTSKS